MVAFSDAWFADYQQRLKADAEMRAIGGWFTTAFSLTCGERRWILRFEHGALTEVIPSPRIDARCAFGFRASQDIWDRFLAERPEPLYHDVFAMLMRVPGFVLEGDSLAALQNVRALHRAMRLMRPDAPGPASAAGEPRDGSERALFEPVVGRYLNLQIDGIPHRIYFEETGQGIPLLCLHTAGADSRQFRHLLNDTAVTTRYRVIAFDMPLHGRSNPPDGWWKERYRLTTRSYLAAIRAVWQALGLTRPVILGCSMGGAIVLKVAAEYQRELRGVVALEGSAYAPGRYNELLHHPAIHGGELAGSYTYGLCAPTSPESGPRENWWYYSQSGPGVYAGDVHFYSMDWDAREDLKRIDTSRCRVSFLTGTYDYSCTPDMTRDAAREISGSRLVIMEGMGHFPMIENYPAFREYLLPELEFMAA